MAISVDSVSSSHRTTNGTTLTFAHTCAANAVLYVAASQGAVATDVITGVTYNSVSLTLAKSQVNTSFGVVDIYYIDTPSSGTHDVVITSGTSGNILGGAISYLGANTSGSLGAVGGANSASAASISLALTTTVDNSVVFNGFGQNGNATQTNSATGTGQTREFNEVDALLQGNLLAGGEQTTTTAGSYTTSYSSTPNEIMALALAEIKPGATSAIKTIDGLAKASVKTVDGLAIASVKTFNGLA